MSNERPQPAGLSDKEIIEAVLERAATDNTFRDRTLFDPKDAIEEVSGQPVPERVNITFIDAQEYDFAFILPDPVEDELSEDHLNAVAGGADFCSIDFDIIDDGDNCGVDINLIDFD